MTRCGHQTAECTEQLAQGLAGKPLAPACKVYWVFTAAAKASNVPGKYETFWNGVLPTASARARACAKSRPNSTIRVLKSLLGIGALRSPSVASWSAGTLCVPDRLTFAKSAAVRASKNTAV